MSQVITQAPPLERGPLGNWIIPDYPPFEPTFLGPSWRRDEDGRFAAPEFTLGWQAIRWAEENLQAERPLPGEFEVGRWKFSNEQKRLLLWWYEVDDRGVFKSRDGVIQRLKGW